MAGIQWGEDAVKVAGKDPDLIVRQDDPLNAGPPLARLREFFLTPARRFFVRNHGSVPEVDPDRYRLAVDGLVDRPLELSLDEIRSRFPEVGVTATLQCAGNRRQELATVRPIPGELPWGAEAIGNAKWTGVALWEVLKAAGVRAEARHVAFLGLDEVRKEGETFGFGGSIPLEKAMGPEVILALEMNGEPLPPVHGFPLRAVVPGYIGARSVKWLGRISVRSEPSTNFFQARAYKIFPPEVTPETAHWPSASMLGEVPVNAVICQPGDGQQVSAGTVRIAGYAVSGGGEIQRVEVSFDGGTTWEPAQLGEERGLWTWRFWEASMDLSPGAVEILVRAWGSGGKAQPEGLEAVWNFKGYVNNAWHRVRVTVREGAA